MDTELIGGPQAGAANAPAAPPDVLEVDEPKADEQTAVATPLQLMWWRFRRHKLAMASVILLLLFYLVSAFAEFFSPYEPNATVRSETFEFNSAAKYVPPQIPRFIDGNGDFTLRPIVFGLTQDRDQETLRITYEVDKSVWYPIEFFVEGTPYNLWGLWESNLHLFGLGAANLLATDIDPVSDRATTLSVEGTMFLLGADRLGRDMLSRVIYGARISLSIGLVSVATTLLLGVVLGGISGYYGGQVDNIVQRVVEFVRSVPSIPLWMALAAALPPSWPPTARYFGLTVILALLSWTGLARQVRGRFLSLREDDFVLAARFSGASEMRVILRHMVPSFMSHIIATLTLLIPSIILTETALSFLGLGLRQPTISWGVLLQEAQTISVVALYPWLLLPGVAVIIAVLAFNFLGDGLRDAADPYG